MHLCCERDWNGNAKWRKAIRMLLPKRMISIWYKACCWVMVDCTWMVGSRTVCTSICKSFRGRHLYAGKLAQRFSLFHRQYCLLVAFNYVRCRCHWKSFIILLLLCIWWQWKSVQYFSVYVWNGLSNIRSTLDGKTSLH